tara:strand:+ start:396 stop:527 length:132 start_codon:yes stop_codon:yes gene_type:complete
MKYYNGGNWISVSKSLIAEKISAQKADVSRVIKRLYRIGYRVS